MGAGDPYQIDCCGCGIDFTPRDGMDVIAAWNRRDLLDDAVRILRRTLEVATRNEEGEYADEAIAFLSKLNEAGK